MTDPLQRVRAFDRRHPLWWDALVTVALIAISLNATPHLDALNLGPLLLIDGAAFFRRRRPLAALVIAVTVLVTVTVVSVFTVVDAPWAYASIWVLLFNVGLRRGGAQLVAAGGFTALAALTAFIAPFVTPVPDLLQRAYPALAVAAMCAASYLAGTQLHLQRRTAAARQQEAARAAVVAERSRIAQEMHDIIGHNLSVITSLANGGSVAVRRAPDDAERAFQAIGEVSRSSVREVRRVLTVLRYDQSPEGTPLTPQPGIDDVAALAETIRAAGVPVSFTRTGDLGAVSAGRQLAAYRIVQESLTNVLRHAGAGARARVSVSRRDDQIVIAIEDDRAPETVDRGSDVASTPGHGILGMRERAEAYGGVLDAGRSPTGWQVRAVIPVAEHDAS